MALFDTQVGVLANQAMNYLVSGVRRAGIGNAHPNIVPYQDFAGRRRLAHRRGRQRRAVRATSARVLGLERSPTIRASPTNASRVANRAALVAALRRRRRKHGGATICSRALEKAVVPAGPINTIAELFADPQFAARGMRIAPQGAPGVRAPLVMSESPLALDRRSPKLGEHQDEVLREIGMA